MSENEQEQTAQVKTVRMVRMDDGTTGDIHPDEVEHMQAYGWQISDDQEPSLRDDGPTVEEYVSAGYLAKNYPPAGYASKSTEEEIAAAIAGQDAKDGNHGAPAVDFSDLTDDQLRAAITEATGKAPHPSAGRDTLIKKLQEAQKGE